MPRATRFVMNLPVRYRVQGEKGWSYGMSINVSASGLLFRADRQVAPHARMQIEVVLPGDEQGSARVAARGAVTRVSSEDPGADRLIAAHLESPDLVRSARSIH
ncbi:MAG TPA: PilZ domain-containing protein [Vicinamibacterales bacterium]|jgi:hypothetical protein|nr:PilZ domain-containing protein [Vicinamibacterales bacterium]